MEIRRIKDEEKDRAFYLWTQAFERGSRGSQEEQEEEWQSQKDSDSYTCGVFDDGGTMQAALLVLNYRIYLGENSIVPMGGIGGVACLPACRGKGYAGAVIRYALEQMRETGHIVSTLYPFSWDYYRRFGWEWVGVKRHYSVPTGVLRPSPETEHVRAFRDGDKPLIESLYAQYARRYRGALQRSEREWNGMLDDKKDKFTYTYLYERDGTAEGYLTYRGGEKDNTGLREFVALTPRAQRGLIGLLKRHEMQVNKFSWSAPEDDPLWLTHEYQWETETKLMPTVSGRVVDVAGALRAWQPPESAAGTFAVAVRDECAAWNQATWRVEFGQGQSAVAVTHDAPDVSLDIQALSQAWFGTPTVPQLRAAHRLQVHSEAGYNALQNFFAGPPMWLNNHF